MKSAPILVATLGVAIFLGLLVLRSRPSVLPAFDAAEFSSHGPSGRSLVQLRGANALRLRTIFEGIPREKDPQKWVAFGRLTLFERGNEVLEIDVLSGPGGEGPFGIKGKGSYLGYDETALKTLLMDFGWQPDPAR